MKTGGWRLVLEPILEVLGASALCLAVLVAFWKADDAISSELRDDIALRILFAKPIDRKTFDPSQATLGLLQRIYGSRHFSLRCMFSSLLISSTLFMILVIFLIPEALLTAIGGASTYERSRVEFGFLFLVLSVLFNAIADYFSVWKSRILLRQNLYPALLIVFDIMLTILIFFCAAHILLFRDLIHNLILGIVTILPAQAQNWILGQPTMQEFVTAVATMHNMFHPSEFSYWANGLLERQYWDFTEMAFFTTFTTVIWSCLLMLGYLALRITKVLIPTIQYALPVEERPLRSIGLVCTIFTLFAVVVGAIIM